MRFRLFFLLLLPAAGLAAADTAVKARATELFRAQQWEDAQHWLEGIVAAEPANAEAFYYLGMSFLNRNDAEHAVAPLEKAVALAPTNSDYLRHLGDAYGLSAQKAGLFAQLGWARKCKEAYEKAVALDPANLRARQSLLEYYRQAPGFAGGGMDHAYEQAAAIQQLDANQGRLAFASLYVSEKKFDEAFALFAAVLKAAPDDYAALYQVGKLAAVTGRNLDTGLAALQRCLGLTPPPDQPGYAPANWRLGNVWEKKGDKAAARAAYQAALRADPKFSPAAEALQKLQ